MFLMSIVVRHESDDVVDGMFLLIILHIVSITEMYISHLSYIAIR